MDDSHDDPDELRHLPNWGPMFSRGSLARAELATDRAIPILAEGGWSALTLRNVARAANVTPQAVAAWFPSVTARRRAVAQCYGSRWIRERGAVARRRAVAGGALAGGAHSDSPTLAEVAHFLLPHTWLEEVYDGIWLSIEEAGRWDEAIGRAVVAVHEQEEDVVRHLLDPVGRREAEDVEVDAGIVMALVRGMRATHAPIRQGRTASIAEPVLAGLRQTQMAAGMPSEKTSGVSGKDSDSPSR